MNEKDFRNYAVHHLNMNGHALDHYTSVVSRQAAPLAASASYINPSIIEERQLNVAQMDVFSRLMMDRIIFLGIAASMAAVLLVAGEKGKRFALRHSRVMIHQPMGGAQGQASDIEITAREIKKLKSELYNIISDHSGQPFEKVERDSDRDYWMTADEACEYGMIDKVLVKAKH